MTLTLPINGEVIRETFRTWNAERDTLDTELSESLVALEAYQLHLDVWQQQLARERDELRAAREQFSRERTAAEKSDAAASTASATDLNAAREKITALTTLLLSRTEELRTLDNRRAEVQTELELARARERELNATLNEHKHSIDQERSQWSEELKQLREVLEHQLDTPAVEEPAAAERHAPPAIPTATAAVHTASVGVGAHVLPRENPVVSSIVQQFGKLRQQRAVERQANRQR